MIKHFNDKYNPHKDVCCLPEKLPFDPLVPYPQLMLDIFDNILIVLSPLLNNQFKRLFHANIRIMTTGQTDVKRDLSRNSINA